MTWIKPTWESDCGSIKLWLGDCRKVMPGWPDGAVGAVVTDPPYGVTALAWDRRVTGWLDLLNAPQLWCFGSLRFWLSTGDEFSRCGWKYGQEIVWEKHNGSGIHADRFRRVHELAVHWYRGDWQSLYRQVPVTADATKRTVRHSSRPAHLGSIEDSSYTTVDGGNRLMRSVLAIRSCHGRAVHPTQKPAGIVEPQVEYSVPPGGLVADPFMGSGTTGVVAARLYRQFWGVEVKPAYFEAAKKRIQDELRRLEFLEPRRAERQQATMFSAET